MPLRVQLQLRIISDDDTVIRDEVILQLDKSGDRLEAIGRFCQASRQNAREPQYVVVCRPCLPTTFCGLE